LSNIYFISFRVHITTRLYSCRVIPRSLLVAAVWLSCCLFFISMHVHLEPTSLLAAEVYFSSVHYYCCCCCSVIKQSAALGCLTSLSLHSWWVPCISRLVLYLRPVLFTIACCCLSCQSMVVRVLCPICLHIVYALCLATAGLRVSQASVYTCILLSGPTPTLAVNLTTVSHSRKCCNFSCNFLSHLMNLGPCFNW